MNWAAQAGFRKVRGIRDEIANIHWIIEKAREFPKNVCFIDYTKAFDCVDHYKEMGIPDHLTCLLRNLYAGQEATVRTGHGTTDWFRVGKGVCQGSTLSPCLFNLDAEYIMWNARHFKWVISWNQDCQEKYQQPQICRWSHSNAESKEKLKSLLMRVKDESEKSWLKTQHSKN